MSDSENDDEPIAVMLARSKGAGSEWYCSS